MSGASEAADGNEKIQCRLCAEYERTKYLIDIFGREGTKHNLDLKIRKCLPIVVQEDDGMPRMVCIDCINRLDMVAVFVESCMRSHHQFINVLTNDPRRRVSGPVFFGNDETVAVEEVLIKAEPMSEEDEIDLEDLPHVLQRKDPIGGGAGSGNPRVAQVFSIDRDDVPTEEVSTIFIKAEPVDVNEED
ncbi:uncharacterized protein LOC135938998 [Cloeon dipterum]|uniref:uncharacterized protein LOC135938998 n=1 Tax=Cloeon dipterum TaxID=197152 RepID=UPI003220244D